MVPDDSCDTQRTRRKRDYKRTREATDGRRKMCRHVVHAWLRRASACEMNMRQEALPSRCHAPRRCRGGRAARAAAAAAARTAAAACGSEIIILEPFWPNSLSWMSSPGGRTRSQPFSSASCGSSRAAAARRGCSPCDERLASGRSRLSTRKDPAVSKREREGERPACSCHSSVLPRGQA